MSTPSGQIAHLGGTNSTLQSSPQKRTLSWITSFNLGFGKKNPQATERRSPAGVPRLKDMTTSMAAVFCYYVSPRASVLAHQGSKIKECAVFIFFCDWKKSGRILGGVDFSGFPLLQSVSMAKPPPIKPRGTRENGIKAKLADNLVEASYSSFQNGNQQCRRSGTRFVDSIHGRKTLWRLTCFRSR